MMHAGPSRDIGSRRLLTVLLAVAVALGVAVPASAGTGRGHRGAASRFGAAAPSLLVRHGSRDVPTVALTFDFGGRIGDAASILRWLTANGVPATIFSTGVTASGTPAGHRVMALAGQHPELFVVGNHSYDHPNFIRLTAAQIASELNRAERRIVKLSGRTTKPWFRPPYGRWNARVLTDVGAAGWSRTVLWDVATDDYVPPSRGGPTPDQMVQEVLGQAQNGSIVIMHLGGYPTRDALPAIVAGLRAEGLTPVTLATLIGP
jgi:peptidoglycan/xylan/chitin deacetylase (PgdA/CDA1 family)